MFEKTQQVRLIDVFILGPFMIYNGTKQTNENRKLLMIGAGLLTIAYNWENYKANRSTE